MHGDMEFANVASWLLRLLSFVVDNFCDFWVPNVQLCDLLPRWSYGRSSSWRWTIKSSALAKRQKTKYKRVFVRQILLQVRYFTPPQADQPEIFIMAEQEGYGGNYGGDGTKPGKTPSDLKIGHL